MKRLSVMILVLALALAAGAATTPAVKKLLPAKDEVKGWGVVRGSMQYGKGEGLTAIYDGGYELYTKNGVIDAAKQTYQRGNDYLEVTVHTMKSSKAALAFLNYWKKELKGKVTSKSIRGANFTISKPNIACYFVSGKYFSVVSAFYSTPSAYKDTEAFMRAVDKKAGGR